MGTTKNGLLKGISGQVGPVQVCDGEGVSIVKIMPKASTKPPKQSQLDQRAIFKTVIKFVTQIQKILDIGYQSYVGAVKPLNAAMSYHLKNAVTGIAPDKKLDFTKVQISKRSGLEEDHTAAAVPAAGNLINLTWDPSEDFDKVEQLERNLDHGMLLVYSETKGLSYTNLGGPTRSEAAYSARLPRVFIGDKVHCYFFFASIDGKVSNSQYLGAMVVLA